MKGGGWGGMLRCLSERLHLTLSCGLGPFFLFFRFQWFRMLFQPRRRSGQSIPGLPW